MKKKNTGLKIILWISLLALVLVIGMYLGTLLVEKATDANVAEYEDGERPIFTKTQVEEQMAELTDAYDQRLAVEVAAKTSDAKMEGYENGRTEVLDRVRTSLLEGKTTVAMLRPLYPEYVVLVSDGDFHFEAINPKLAKHSLLQENVEVLESGEYRYTENGEVTSHKGIDVSSHQGKIDWEKVAADGVEFAIMRVLYRGYTSGKLVEDETFDANMTGAIDVGIRVGAYVFSQAITEAEMLEEANTAIEKVSKYASSVPIVIDVERVAGSKPRQDNLSVEERTKLVKLFCDTVKEAGFTPYIYYNTEMSVLFLDLEQLEEYPKWYASYVEEIFYPYKFDIWQYSAKGSVSGISTDVDLDIALTTFWK